MISIKPKNTIWTNEQWEAIYKDNTNIIVSAGAGSGKTAVLTERIVEKIKNGININDLIVLTFTNAAAFEMKNRVRKKLLKIKEDERINEQLALLDQASICTFDSFALSLVKKYHYLFNIDHDINIIDDNIINSKKKELMNSIFNDYYSEHNSSFLNFINTFTIKDDDNIQSIIINISDKMDIIYNKKEYLDNYINTFYNDGFIDNNINKYIKIINDYKKNIVNNLNNIKDNINNELLDNFYEKLENNINLLKNIDSYNEYKSVINNIKLPNLPQGKKIDPIDIECIKEYYNNIKNDLKNITDMCSYNNVLDIKNEILATKEDVMVIIDIIKKFDTKLFDYKLINNQFTFNDIMRLAISLLEENEEIRNLYKNNIKEIMIDEYQDTNDIGDYLINLIGNNNIYMVGDVKQSIYGFRNANPKIFMDKYDKYASNNNGYKIDLNKNFRSRNEVLDGINNIFKFVMDKNIGGADYNNGHAMIFGNDAYNLDNSQNNDIEILNYNYKDSDYRKEYKTEELEAFIIANDIKNKISNNYKVYDKDLKCLRTVNYSDFCILIDRKTTFDLYKKIFTYLNIPLTIHKDEDFIYSDEIYVINSILKLIISIKDKEYYKLYFDHAFMSLTRSFLFDYSDDDIFNIFLLSKNSNNSIINIIKNNDNFNNIYEKLMHLYDYSINNSLSSLLIEIYNTFDIYKLINKIGNVKITSTKLDYLLDLTINLENNGCNLLELVNYISNIFEEKSDITFNTEQESINTVNIMTIHKSKGLEFKVCYYSGLNKNFSIADIKDKFLFNNTYGIVIPTFNEGIKETIYKTLVKYDYNLINVSEKLRLFYVSLTRSEEKIIMVTNLESDDYLNGDMVNDNKRLNYKNFKDILTSIKNKIINYIKDVNLGDMNLTKQYEINISSNYESKIKKENNNFSYKSINVTPTKKCNNHYSVNNITDNNELLEIGTKVHSYLELIDFKNYINDLNNYNIDNIYKDKIIKFLNQPFIDDLNNCIIYKEYEFIYNDYHGFIDLMLEYDDKIIIVDYKLKNIDKDYYIKQINGYKEYIKHISNKQVNAYLYSILDENYIEVK